MKKLIRAIGIVVALLVVAAVSLPFLVNANEFRPRLESELTTALGRDVKVGDLSLDLMSGSVSASELSVADDRAFSSSPFLHARSLKLTVQLWPLITSRKLNVDGLTIDGPEISLIQSDAGNWNFSGLGAKPPPAAGQKPVTEKASAQAPLEFSVKLFRITNGKLSLGHVPSRVKPQVIDNVTLEVRDFAPKSAFPLSFGARLASGGDISLTGKAGPLDSVDAAATPVEVTLKVSGLQLASSGFIDPAAGIDGVLSIDGTGGSNGNNVRWNGVVKLDKPKLAKKGTPAKRSLEFDFTLNHDLRKHSGVLSKGDIHVGQATARLTGTYAQKGEATSVSMHIAGPAMPIPELAEMLPSLDVTLPSGTALKGGTAQIDMTVDGPTTAIVAAGSLGVNNTSLTGFDLSQKLSSIQLLTGIKPGANTEIQTLSARVRSAPEGTSADDIKLVLPALGELDGAGTVSASKALDFKMRAVVRSSGGLLSSVGQATVPFFVQGTADAPVFKPDVRALAAAELQRFNKNTGKAVTGILGGLFGGNKKK